MVRKKTEKKDVAIMKRTALFFEPQQLADLERLSDHSGAPVAELVRRAVTNYLELRRSELDSKPR